MPKKKKMRADRKFSARPIVSTGLFTAFQIGYRNSQIDRRELMRRKM